MINQLFLIPFLLLFGAQQATAQENIFVNHLHAIHQEFQQKLYAAVSAPSGDWIVPAADMQDVREIQKTKIKLLKIIKNVQFIQADIFLY
jgi:hypothetical protein